MNGLNDQMYELIRQDKIKEMVRKEDKQAPKFMLMSSPYILAMH